MAEWGMHRISRSTWFLALLAICLFLVGNKLLHLPILLTPLSPLSTTPAAVERCRKDRRKAELSPAQTVKSLHLYHISKCGGSTLNAFFKSGGLSAAGRSVWKGEMEDRPFADYRFCSSPPNTHCAPTMKKPAGTFIIGTVRNPYDYYVSYWLHHLRVAAAQPDYRGCEEREAEKQGLLQELYHPTLNSDPAAFRRWLKWVLLDTADLCGIGMWRLYRRMYLEHDASLLDSQGRTAPSIFKEIQAQHLQTSGEHTYQYDAIVRTEHLVGDLEQALTGLDCPVGGTQSGLVDWDYFAKWGEDAIARKEGPACVLCNRAANEKESIPYSCYYDEESTAMVARIDAEVLARHEYTPGSREHCEGRR
jgi:hypothetical protein